ncbi:sporulation histidine kinase inhibitor Sda [Halobacillus sp. KGW1]|uniref:sporulation histidine kinase inhibitor Sda n=1 Tax=Halobacillus sp. KGW1 TaxID=1793726 RepID=UPI000783046E|nr:sporulation histidine kinase inhibitor Sda [Halobacillus sp. KGW1]
MNKLSDELLLDTFRAARRHGLSEDFQMLLRTEMKKRGLLDSGSTFGTGPVRISLAGKHSLDGLGRISGY